MILRHYLYSQLAITFFPIFLALYFITSVIFLVKIASLTSVITINFTELFTLYLYMVPNIIFYTLPFSFFISLVITLSKLSSEYELTVITSFGLNPVNILKVLLPISLLVSITLMIVSVGLIPKAKFLNNQFLTVKKKEANFNIQASEFGQKFNNWLIYIEGEDGKVYKEVKLFQTQKGKDQFILSKTAILDNDNGELSFKLNNGNAFFIDEKELNQIGFESMYINDSIVNTNLDTFTTSYNFWIDRISRGIDIDDLTLYILLSLFPTLSLFLVITFGYFNPRYEKNRAVTYSIVFMVFYYILIVSLRDSLLLHSLYIIPIVWMAISYTLYSRTVKKEY